MKNEIKVKGEYVTLFLLMMLVIGFVIFLKIFFIFKLFLISLILYFSAKFFLSLRFAEKTIYVNFFLKKNKIYSYSDIKNCFFIMGVRSGAGMKIPFNDSCKVELEFLNVKNRLGVMVFLLKNNIEISFEKREKGIAKDFEKAQKIVENFDKDSKRLGV